MKLRVYVVIILGVVAVAAAAAVAVPSISYVVHQTSNPEDAIMIHATNITSEQKAFIRLEIKHLEPTSSPGGWIVQDYRRNALCECDSVCEESERRIQPWETWDFVWDGRAEDCSLAKPGKYKAQLVAECRFKGCLGSYYIGIGESFYVEH